MSNSTPRLDCLAEQPIRWLKRDDTLLFAALLRKTKPHLHIVMAEPRFNLRLSPAGLYLEGGLSEYNPQVPWISYHFSSFEHYSQLPLPFAAWHRDASKPMSCANVPRGCTSHGSAALLELLGTSSESCNPKPGNRTGNLKTVVSRKADDSWTGSVIAPHDLASMLPPMVMMVTIGWCGCYSGCFKA